MPSNVCSSIALNSSTQIPTLHQKRKIRAFQVANLKSRPANVRTIHTQRRKQFLKSPHERMGLVTSRKWRHHHSTTLAGSMPCQRRNNNVADLVFISTEVMRLAAVRRERQAARLAPYTTVSGIEIIFLSKLDNCPRSSNKSTERISWLRADVGILSYGKLRACQSSTFRAYWVEGGSWPGIVSLLDQFCSLPNGLICFSCCSARCAANRTTGSVWTPRKPPRAWTRRAGAAPAARRASPAATAAVWASRLHPLNSFVFCGFVPQRIVLFSRSNSWGAASVSRRTTQTAWGLATLPSRLGKRRYGWVFLSADVTHFSPLERGSNRSPSSS